MKSIPDRPTVDIPLLAFARLSWIQDQLKDFPFVRNFLFPEIRKIQDVISEPNARARKTDPHFNKRVFHLVLDMDACFTFLRRSMYAVDSPVLITGL